MADTGSAEFAARVRALAALAARVSVGDGSDGAVTVALRDALRAEPGVEEVVRSHVLRRREIEVWTGLLNHVRDEAGRLEWLAGLDLTAAPRLVDVVPLGTYSGVLISRYAAFPGERLVRVGPQALRPAAQERFLRDMEVLAERGVIHPYAGRGFHHLWVTSETGGIVLDSWATLREATARDSARVLRAVGDLFVEAAVAAAVQRLDAVRWGTAPTWERRARDLLLDFYRRLLPYWPVDADRILPADPRVVAALRALLSPTDAVLVAANVERLGQGRSPTVGPLIELVLIGAVLRGRGRLDEATEPGGPLLHLFEAGYDLHPTHGGVDVMYATGMTTVPLPTRRQLG